MGHAHIQRGKSGKTLRVEYSELDDIVEHTGDKFVCADCFDDEGVKNFIREFDSEEDEWDACSYCNNPQGLHLDYVAEHIFERVRDGWEPAHHPLPWEETTDMHDIVGEYGIENQLLFDDIMDAIPHNDWQWKRISSYEGE